MTNNNITERPQNTAIKKIRPQIILPTTKFITNVPAPTDKLKYCDETVEICGRTVRHLGSELAARLHLKVHRSTWSSWKNRYPEFADALLRGREEHVKYTLKDHTEVKLDAVRSWEKYLKPQKRVRTNKTWKQLEDKDGKPLTMQNDEGEEVGVFEAHYTETTYWIEPNLKVIAQAMGTENIDTFVLERLGTEYIDMTEDVIIQLLGKFVDLEEIKSAPEMFKYLLAPEIDILMLRKQQIVNESRLMNREITHKEHTEIALAVSKVAIDAAIKLEMKRKAPFGNNSYSQVTADYRNLTYNIVNIFREVIDDDRIDRNKIIEKVYDALGERDAAGAILGAILRSEPQRTGSEDPTDSDRSKDG